MALELLRERGFEIEGVNVPLTISNFQISDVDVIAVKEGVKYAVEVKSGRLDVGGVRQAYVNALLMKARPLVVCRGFSDQGAEALAKELGVEVIEMEDLFLSDPEELRSLIREEVRRVLLEVMPSVLGARSYELDERELTILRAVGRSNSFLEAAELLGMTPEELGKEISKLRGSGKIPKWVKGFDLLKEWASFVVLAP